MVLFNKFVVNARFVIHPLTFCDTYEFYKVFVACLVFCNQNKVERVGFLGIFFMNIAVINVKFAANKRFYAC